MRPSSAIRYNPAVRRLFARLVARNPKQKAGAIGHALRKLLHLAFAVWKTDKPFNPDHYAWHTPAHAVLSDSDLPVSVDAEVDLEPAEAAAATNQAAGHNPETEPERSVVTAARPNSLAIDFGHLKQQLPLARVLDQLGISDRLRGSGDSGAAPARSTGATAAPKPSACTWATTSFNASTPGAQEGRRDRPVGECQGYVTQAGLHRPGQHVRTGTDSPQNREEERLTGTVICFDQSNPRQERAHFRCAPLVKPSTVRPCLIR